MNIKLFLKHSLWFLLTLPYATFADQQNAYLIQGMVGQQPTKIMWIINQLKAAKTGFQNRLILHGPPGNGKTTLAKKIAEMTNGVLLTLDGPSIVESYVGKGAQNVTLLFERAGELIATIEKPVIILIDEIDAIAGDNKTEFRSEHSSALQQLWLELDRYKNEPRLLAIFATNNLKKLSKPFLDRFGANVIEIPNPDAPLRRTILEYYFTKADVPLSEDLCSTLVKKTDGLSIRSLEDLSKEIKMAADIENNGTTTETIVYKSLSTIKKKFEQSAPESERYERLQKIGTIVSIISGSVSALYTLKCMIAPYLENHNFANWLRYSNT